MDILITNIKTLVQVRDTAISHVAGNDMAECPMIADAYLAIKDGKIHDFGKQSEMPEITAKETIDAAGQFVMPGFVDSHTHLIFAASREEEFVMKIKGASYQDIAEKGGGILNSARKLRDTSEELLLSSALDRLDEVIAQGTVAIEIKSGYGLSVESELKMLRVARKLAGMRNVLVRSTFLGAHAVPQGMEKPDYIQLLINEMIPAVAAENLAHYIDVFCENGFFNKDETIQIVEAGKQYGMKPRIHANQLNRSGGVQAGVQTHALSVDHLENIGEEEIEMMKGTDVMPTALPGAAFFLRLPFTPARQIIDAGLPLAIASDYNPGSAPSGNMHTMMALACIGMRMTPEEALNACTINTAKALELENEYGSITKGKVASIIITKPMPSLAYFPYAFGSQLIDKVILQGKEIISNS
ncbi:MAG TPA: imidazolonepropionase [Cyclobacteriaceae bacterium]|nr:imidazolonepropionase [Cyclobacteriaceae bacterium]